MKVAFVCTGNAARSQMAEGLLRSLGGGKAEAFSAGTHPWRVHPSAVEVMGEIGVDISEQYSKGIEELPQDLDVVITLCDSAAAECPVIPANRQRQHWSIPDPSFVADEEMLEAFRKTRDDLRERILEFLKSREI